MDMRLELIIVEQRAPLMTMPRTGPLRDEYRAECCIVEEAGDTGVEPIDLDSHHDGDVAGLGQRDHPGRGEIDGFGLAVDDDFRFPQAARSGGARGGFACRH